MGMQIKKFRASSLQKAIEQVRRELGDNAIILQADSVAKPGPLGGTEMEVTAALDRKAMPPRFSVRVDDSGDQAFTQQKPKPMAWKELLTQPFGKKMQKTSKPKIQKQVNQVVNAAVQKEKEKPALPPLPTSGQNYSLKSYLDPLKKEIEDLRKTLEGGNEKSSRQPSVALLEAEINSLKKALTHYIQERTYERTDLSADLQRLISYWQEHGMSDRQIFGFLSQLEKEGVDLDQVNEATKIKNNLESHIKSANTIENPKQKIVALVGPTGVGKTTTIAKLAAFEKLKMNRRVALVTIDDYKIGGTDQLNHYARILEVPFVKIRSDLSLEEQIKTLDADTIFIDTFGISPRDDDKIQKLRKSLRFTDPLLQKRLELHLALPVAIPSGDVEGYIEGFSRLHPDFLLFTKWDETDNWGGMLASILMSERPVSFVGHGQEVPEDLSIFSSESFIDTVTATEN